jgi:hypothetical protein
VKTPNNDKCSPGITERCAFYKQAEQMFIWLTSAPPPNYGNGRYVFMSPVFKAISASANGQRNLISQPDAFVSGEILDVTLAQTGPHGSAVVFDAKGEMYELIHPAWVSTAAGALIEVLRTQISREGKPLFIGKDNHPIRIDKDARLLDSNLTAIIPTDKTIVVGGIRYQIDSQGKAIAYSTGQADKSVLMTQSGKLVYYGILVNDVYTYFHEVKYRPNQAISDFPTTREEIEQLGQTFPDVDALIVAVKTAWVEVRDEEKENYKGRFLTIDASIRPYTETEPKCPWTPARQRSAVLALVGMHVAFSAKKQPGMIWATFEHVDNARNLKYHYVAGAGMVPSLKTELAIGYFRRTRRRNLSTCDACISTNTDKLSAIPKASPRRLVPAIFVE